MNLEKQWIAAVKAGNLDRVSLLLADNFTGLDSEGVLSNKAEYLGSLQGSRWEINEISDVKVASFGNTIVTTGIWRGKGVIGKASVDARERFVDTWMPNGKWQCIASGNASEKM